MFNLKKKSIDWLACLIVGILSLHVEAEEIAPFRLTGVDGEVFINFLTDDYRTRYDGEQTSQRGGATAEEGFDMTLRSYFYHPKFLRFDFGGGPVFMQHYYDSDRVDADTDTNQFLNLHAKANLLEDKPYPLILFYDRNTTTTPYAVEDRMIIQRENYGMHFTLRKPLIPFVINADHTFSDINGVSALRVTDESVERASLSARGDLGSNGDGSIAYFWSMTDSASGARDLPINPTRRLNEKLDIQTKHLFGGRQHIRFSNNFYYKVEDFSPGEKDDLSSVFEYYPFYEADDNPFDLEEIRYIPRLGVTHTKNLRSFYRYGYLDRTQGQIDTTTHAVDVGFGYAIPEKRIDMDGDVHGDNFQTDGFEQDFASTRYNISYLQPFNVFSLKLSGGWGGDYTNRVTTEDEISVVGERHVLIGTAEVELINAFVVDGTVSVFNRDRTQTYTENIDYELITRGDVTSIRRLPTSNIQDGEEVLVDYAYQTGGTAEFTGFNQSYRVELMQGRIWNVYGQYRDIQRDLISGIPSVPLNSQRTRTAGFRLDYPFLMDWTAGGNAEYESHDADIGSYRRKNAGVYLQTPRFRSVGSFRVFFDRLLVDNLDSVEDVNLTRTGLRYHARWGRTTLTADTIHERDSGGTRYRSNISSTVRLDWSYRQLKLSGEARYKSNELGDSETDRSSLSLMLSREF